MINKSFNTLVFIGRFQPFHNGHQKIVDTALENADEVIVVVGSSFAARNIRNPFTFQERRDMIKAVYPQDNVKVVPVSDYPYDDNKWITAVRNVVSGAMKYTPDPMRIGLIGHSKDESSYYLKIFPDWGSIDVENHNNINATDIRKTLFETNPVDVELLPIPFQMEDVLKNTINHRITYLNFPDRPPHYMEHAWFTTLREEYEMVKKYKEAWKVAPFPPTFVTVDAIVVQSGHVLLVKRGAMPGKGLWAHPGGFLEQSETLMVGALRELKEETKIKVPVPVLRGSIKEVKTFDAPNRSMRGRTITTAFFIDLGYGLELPKVTGADDAEKAKWFPINEIRQDMMFEDHYFILDHFLNLNGV